MGERELFQTKSKNFLGILFFALAGVTILAMFLTSYILTHNPFRCIDYLEYGYWAFPAGAVVFVVPGILFWHSWTLKITNVRVSAETSTGKKRIDLPVNKITAVGYGIFGSIVVATPHGSIHLFCVEKRKETFEVLSGLLSDQR